MCSLSKGLSAPCQYVILRDEAQSVERGAGSVEQGARSMEYGAWSVESAGVKLQSGLVLRTED